MGHGTTNGVSVGGVTTNGTCSFRGNAQVSGGTHTNLVATGDTKILGNVSTYRVTATGKTTISGNIHIYKAQIGGDTVIKVPDDLPEPAILASKNNLTGGSEYDQLRYDFKDITPHPTRQGTVWDSSYLAPAAGILRGLTATYGLLKSTSWREFTTCLKASKHKAYTPNCRCLMWYPLIMAGDPLALQYLFRVEGLCVPLVENADYPALDGTIRNPLSTLSFSALENLLSAKVSSVMEDCLQDDADTTDTNLYPWGVYVAEDELESADAQRVINNIYLNVCRNIQPIYHPVTVSQHQIKSNFATDYHATWHKYVRQLPESWLAHYRNITNTSPTI